MGDLDNPILLAWVASYVFIAEESKNNYRIQKNIFCDWMCCCHWLGGHDCFILQLMDKLSRHDSTRDSAWLGSNRSWPIYPGWTNYRVYIGVNNLWYRLIHAGSMVRGGNGGALLFKSIKVCCCSRTFSKQRLLVATDPKRLSVIYVNYVFQMLVNARYRYYKVYTQQSR